MGRLVIAGEEHETDTARPPVEWMSADETAPGVVRLRAFNLFADTGETIVEELELRFRELETVTSDLESAGFVVRAVYGDWVRTPFRGHEQLMIFVAQAAAV